MFLRSMQNLIRGHTLGQYWIGIDIYRSISYKDTKSTWAAQCINFIVYCVTKKKYLKNTSNGIRLFTKWSINGHSIG